MGVAAFDLGLGRPDPGVVTVIRGLCDLAARPRSDQLIDAGAPDVGWFSLVVPIDRSRAPHPLGAIDDLVADVFVGHHEVYVAIAHNDYDSSQVELLRDLETSVGTESMDLDNGWRVSVFKAERALPEVARALAVHGISPQIVVSPGARYLSDLTWFSGILWLSPADFASGAVPLRAVVIDRTQPLRPLVRSLIDAEG